MHKKTVIIGVVLKNGKIYSKSVQIGLKTDVYLSSKFILDSCVKNPHFLYK